MSTQKRTAAQRARSEKTETMERHRRQAVIFIGMALFVAAAAAVVVAIIGSANPYEIADEDLGSIVPGDWVKGSVGSPNVLIKYSDFQCPACGAYDQAVQELIRIGVDFQLVYRHFPLVMNHPNAFPAALASEAAGLQGRFWEMHDVLFEQMDQWADLADPLDAFRGYAMDIGIDQEQFAQDLVDPDLAKKVEAHMDAGRRVGVRSTPTFVLNGRPIQNPTSIEAFAALIRGN